MAHSTSAAARADAVHPGDAIPLVGKARPTFDELARLDCAQLEALFASGQGFPLASLHGDPAGRALAVPALDKGLGAWIVRAIHGSSWQPWEGKSFGAARNATENRGMNRIRWFRRHARFEFKTYETASVIDGAPCVAIDYDVPSNAKLARPIYDELRLIADQLYLGRGMRRTKAGAKLVVWFALDNQNPDARVDWDGY